MAPPSKMKLDELPPEGPTRSSVYELLNSILSSRYDSREQVDKHPAVVMHEQAVLAREQELEKDAKLLKLRQKVKEVRGSIEFKLSFCRHHAKKVLREFEATGLTPAVKKKLTSLVEMVNKE